MATDKVFSMLLNKDSLLPFLASWLRFKQQPMTIPPKYRRLLLIGLGILIVALGCVGIMAFKFYDEFSKAEGAEGHWVGIQDFVKANGRYPKDEAEIGAFFHETPEELKQEPVEYIAPHDFYGDEVILWFKKKTIFGVQIGVTQTGSIVKVRGGR